MHRTNRHDDINAAKIIGVQFSLLSPEEIRKTSVAQVTSRDTYINDRPVIGGLFDPRMGVLDPGLICPTDGLNYMQTPGYFGHIELARPVFFIQYLNTILKVCRCICIKCSKLLIDKKKYSHALDMKASKRWQYVFSLASKISRCGEDCEDGCGCKQPKKIHKEGLATLFAEWANIEGIKDDEGNVKDKLTMKLTCEQVLKLFRRISDEDVTFMGFSPLWSRPDWMICQVLPVPPPAVRPSVKHDAQQRSEDDISHIIVNIIKANKTLTEKMQQDANAKVIDDWTTVLQYYCATMIDNHIPGCAPVAQRTGRALKSMKERLVGKGGRVRGNLMGKRVDFSARSVITPDANIGIRELGVPLAIAKNITYPVVVNERNKKYLTRLVLNGPEVHPGAKILERKSGESISLRYVDRASLDIMLGDIVHRHLLDGDPVLFNRQPSLHKMSMMCHIARILKQGNTFRLNVGVTKPYNADFDGDEMNMHAAQNDEAKAELLNLASVPRQIISPANNQSIIGIFQDSLLGIYRFTRPGMTFSPRTAMNLLMRFDNIKDGVFDGSKKRISNFNILSQILPPMSAKFPNKSYDDDDDRKTTNNIIEIRDGKYMRGQIDKGVLGATSKGLIQSIFNDFGFNSSADFIDNLQNIVNYYMMISSYSVGISDLIADSKTNEEIATAITAKKQDVKNLLDQIQLGVFENNTGKTNEEEFETKVNAILNKAQEEAGKIGRKSLSRDNRFVTMVNAGSKGNNINIAQMISCLGQQNVDGKRIPYGFSNRTLPHFTKYDDSPESRGFVENSFIEGLNPFELYFHAMGGRVGLIDTAVKTSQTGYIQRRLIKGLEDLNIKYDMTVRNNKNKVVQFEYGDDGIETTKVESQALPLSKLTLEEIYAHYQLPFDLRSSTFKSNFTREAISRMKKQKRELVTRTKAVIADMIKGRQLLVENVFHNSNDTRIHIPVNFKRIINNIQFQFNLQNNSLVDVTPMELYNMLDKTLASLSQRYVRPTALFKLAYKYHLSPKELLIVRHFNRNALTLLMETIILQYKKSIVSPGEMAGIIAAQSIGEPTTQMTLNTFHFAGVASKSNVTRGVPRIEEILSLSAHPKKPSTTIFLKEDEQEDRLKAQEQMYLLELTSLQDVTSSVSICFDPDDLNTLIETDKVLMTEYKEFQTMLEECGAEEETTKKGIRSKWIIRFEFDRSAMLDKNISMSDIHYALKHSYKGQLQCIYTDTNSDSLVMRIRLTQPLTKGKKKTLDQSDEIYCLKTLQENLLKNVILRGVKKIPKVTIRKIPNYLTLHDGNYEPREIWVLDTIGTNLEDILMLEDIDINRTYSNDIQETYRVLGIEAARATIYNELSEVLEFDGTYINYHHVNLLCDRIAATKTMVSIFRHGINNDDIGPLAKASFEETPEMFLRAARHAELDNMRGISANVMCGQEGYFGTNSFQVILDIAKARSLEHKEAAKKVTIGDFMGMEDPNDTCSTANMAIANSTEFLEVEDLGDDDDYDAGF
jgi:DNA-directed RNA polymerase II subunit RPB1